MSEPSRLRTRRSVGGAVATTAPTPAAANTANNTANSTTTATSTSSGVRTRGRDRAATTANPTPVSEVPHSLRSRRSAESVVVDAVVTATSTTATAVAEPVKEVKEEIVREELPPLPMATAVKEAKDEDSSSQEATNNNTINGSSSQQPPQRVSTRLRKVSTKYSNSYDLSTENDTAKKKPAATVITTTTTSTKRSLDTSTGMIYTVYTIILRDYVVKPLVLQIINLIKYLIYKSKEVTIIQNFEN